MAVVLSPMIHGHGPHWEPGPVVFGCRPNPPSGAHAAVPAARAPQHALAATPATSPFAGLRVAAPKPSPFASLRVAPAAPAAAAVAVSPFADLRVAPPDPDPAGAPAAAWASPFANLRAASTGHVPLARAVAGASRGKHACKRGAPQSQLKWLKRVCLAAGKKRKAMSATGTGNTASMLSKVLNQNFTAKIFRKLGGKVVAPGRRDAVGAPSVFGDSPTSPFAQVVRAAAAAAAEK